MQSVVEGPTHNMVTIHIVDNIVPDHGGTKQTIKGPQCEHRIKSTPVKEPIHFPIIDRTSSKSIQQIHVRLGYFMRIYLSNKVGVFVLEVIQTQS